MKRSIFKILIPILCAAILLTGCALARTITSTLDSAAGQTSYSTEIVTDAQPSEVVNVPTDPYETTNDTTDSQSSDSEESSGAFSARDLSAEYDDETVAGDIEADALEVVGGSPFDMDAILPHRAR